MISNLTLENYKYKQYSTNPADWWYWQTPYAFRMLSHSDQFKPGGFVFVLVDVQVCGAVRSQEEGHAACRSAHAPTLTQVLLLPPHTTQHRQDHDGHAGHQVHQL